MHCTRIANFTRHLQCLWRQCCWVSYGPIAVVPSVTQLHRSSLHYLAVMIARNRNVSTKPFSHERSQVALKSFFELSCDPWWSCESRDWMGVCPHAASFQYSEAFTFLCERSGSHTRGAIITVQTGLKAPYSCCFCTLFVGYRSASSVSVGCFSSHI